MNGGLPVLLEAAVFLAIYLLALASAAPVRRRCGIHGDTTVQGVAGGKQVLGYIARPLAVLLISLAIIGVTEYLLGLGSRLHPYEHHVNAWFLFWSAVLLVNLVEGIALQGCRMVGRVFPIPDLIRSIIKGLLLLGVVFAVLRYQLNLNISPLLASTALVTAVVGFALQGVLGNLLAGMSLHVVRSMMPSDWVSVGDVEGEVIQTNWRETRLRTVHGHIMIVPNSKMADAILHNMTSPTTLRRHRIQVGASYSDAPADVIEALLESAASVPEVLRDPPPTAYLTEYKDFGINYELRFWITRYQDRIPIQGDVGRMIWYQFKRRNIEIPFPMSDKLLNDFMEVVYTQRRMQPEESEVQRTRADLFKSDFVSKLMVDDKGAPLLKEEDLRDIARSVRRVHYTRGETVFRQGGSGETCYVVVWGHVHGKVEYQDAAQANEFDLGPGSLFGEMSLLTGLPRTATISVSKEVELLEIAKEAFTALLSLRPDVPEILARLVAERAAHNAATFEKLKSMGGLNMAESLKKESILKRFLRFLKRD